MPRFDRARLRAIEIAASVLVLAVVAVTFGDLPQPYPTWPTVAGVPVNPELVVPGLLGLVTIAGAIDDGLGVASGALAVISLLTLWLALSSLYTLYAGEAGGVFWGGFFTLLAGGALAVAVLAREAFRRLALASNGSAT